MNKINEIKSVHVETKKLKSDAGDKNKIKLLKLKVELLEKENNSLENEINSKQDLVDLILEYNLNFLRQQSWRFRQHPETDQGNHGVRSNAKNDEKCQELFLQT